MNVNIEGGRYECPVCGQRAATLSEKKAHIRAAHPRGTQ